MVAGACSLRCSWVGQGSARTSLAFSGSESTSIEVIIDQWNPSSRRYQTETFCYGPRSCPLYQSGPARKVPDRHGMSYTEEDWVDDEATSHCSLDD